MTMIESVPDWALSESGLYVSRDGELNAQEGFDMSDQAQRDVILRYEAKQKLREKDPGRRDYDPEEIVFAGMILQREDRRLFVSDISETPHGIVAALNPEGSSNHLVRSLKILHAQIDTGFLEPIDIPKRDS